MKYSLSSLLNGMEMNKTEHEWLERRFDNMTAKEELLFRGAMLLERPMTMEETIRVLQGLDHYQLFYGADGDAKLGAFVMEHIHIPRPEARDYLAPETVGAAYRAGGTGCSGGFLDAESCAGCGGACAFDRPDDFFSRSLIRGPWIAPHSAVYLAESQAR